MWGSVIEHSNESSSMVAGSCGTDVGCLTRRHGSRQRLLRARVVSLYA